MDSVDMGRLEGKAAIVTGSASGIGKATAIAMAAEGAAVMVADMNGGGAEEVVEQIRLANGTAEPWTVDVADEGAVAAMVSGAVSAFGRLDILHNNAADTGDVVDRDRGLIDLPVDVWRRTMQVNLDGMFFGIKYVLPHLISAGGGSIINTSSASAARGDLLYAAYGTSKGGVESLTRYTAVMYGKDGVRCNAIAPGVVLTDNARTKLSPEIIGTMERHQLLQRLGEPLDIAKMAVFLASDDAAWVTAQVIRVDGGLLSQNPTVPYFRDLGQ
jgi:NAD(P)-dependent dehydrogenase (short-subunit alcohol dehydrogenase family)